MGVVSVVSLILQLRFDQSAGGPRARAASGGRAGRSLLPPERACRAPGRRGLGPRRTLHITAGAAAGSPAARAPRHWRDDSPGPTPAGGKTHRRRRGGCRDPAAGRGDRLCRQRAAGHGFGRPVFIHPSRAAAGRDSGEGRRARPGPYHDHDCCSLIAPSHNHDVGGISRA
jgi:hypothetical protein